MTDRDWRPISEAPDVDHLNPLRCLVFSQDAGVQMGRVFRYPDGEVHANAEGFHGDWHITHWMPLPAPPLQEKHERE